ncbi:MAG: tRNA (adenosine(37)-N6)-threonylcarbamoyltransferase complex dimerization subunit type 1 TsaB [Bacilli bacterium]|nr:tRNA (adenosine(37)-N6)-threonylcarbamoyltransferase complex dimerization subunit type 1 TsaB [Bacilli bacterium]
MKLLIDSSTNYLYLAIINNEQVNSFVRFGKNDHSETLVDYLNKFLQQHQISVQDIKEVYVGRGPGSYTGLRIAGTVGKVLSHINNKKLYSFSSLDLILATKLETPGLYISRIDAKKNHSYYKIVNIDNNEVKVIVEETFGENTIFENYQDYQILEMTEEFFKENLALNIIKYNLYQEESTLDYTPNYIRSGI